MIQSVRRSAWATLAIMTLFCSSPCGAETVTVAGSGAVDEFLRRVSSKFTARTGIQVESIKSLGSAGALHAVAEGVIDIAISSQLPTAEQEASGLRVAFALRTPFVWVTSHSLPQSLTIADIRQAYTTGKAWSDGTPIRVMLRGKQSADTLLLEQLFPGLAAAMDAARNRPDIPIAAGGDPDNADLAERTPGSLTAITYLQVVAEKRKLRFVTLDGVEPTLENFNRGLYVYAKTLAFVVPARVKPAAESFIAFVRSSEGEDLYRQAHGY